jgi:phosphate transport system protein
MTTHLEDSLQRDANRLRDRIAKMGALAVRTLQECSAALASRDSQLAQLIVVRDQRIDQFEKDIDQLCLEFLLRHQPAGSLLRFAYSALKINFELERVGDYAESIARQILKLQDLDCRVPSRLFVDISSASISMLRSAVTAFVRQDADLADATAQIEERVDVLRNQANTELLHLVQSNQIPLAALAPLMTIARRFERVSDQAKSMCLETIYTCTGDYTKHAESQVIRVLFVDENHGCLSRMAEALGRCLKSTGMTFDSAGLEPQPLESALIDFLKDKALPVPDRALRPVPAAAEFSHYHVVVAFSPAVRSRLPLSARKSAQLDWAIADPCRASAEPGDLARNLESAYRAVSQEIAKLVAILTPEEHPITDL